MLQQLYQKIGIWGDSILKGVVFDDARRTYTLLRDSCVTQVGRALGLDVLNRSRFGSTVDKGRTMLEKALDKGLDCDAVLLEYGGNDCDFDWQAVSDDPDAPHRPHTDIRVFGQELETMVSLLRQHNISPVLMSLPPIHGERYLEFLIRQGNLNRDNMMRFLGDASTIYKYQEAYSLTVSRLAAATRCRYLPVREAFLTTPGSTEFICSDGIHPNAKGHDLMRRVLMEHAAAEREVGPGILQTESEQGTMHP